MENNRAKPVDTTLRLRPPSPQIQENPSVDTGNTELHGSSSMGTGTNTVGPPNTLFYQLVYYPPQDNGSPNRQRDVERVCRACGTNTSPLWRKGPQGRQSLCNACGLKHLRALKRGAE